MGGMSRATSQNERRQELWTSRISCNSTSLMTLMKGKSKASCRVHMKEVNNIKRRIRSQGCVAKARKKPIGSTISTSIALMFGKVSTIVFLFLSFVYFVFTSVLTLIYKSELLSSITILLMMYGYRSEGTLASVLFCWGSSSLLFYPKQSLFCKRRLSVAARVEKIFSVSYNISNGTKLFFTKKHDWTRLSYCFICSSLKSTTETDFSKKYAWTGVR